jgi:hypothetical protein
VTLPWAGTTLFSDSDAGNLFVSVRETEKDPRPRSSTRPPRAVSAAIASTTKSTQKAASWYEIPAAFLSALDKPALFSVIRPPVPLKI